jgi:hypothetical protein
MTTNLPSLYTESFSSNLLLRLQQETTLLRGKVIEGTHVGEAVSPVNYVSAVNSRAPSGVLAPITFVNADFMRRWVTAQNREVPQAIDTFQQLQTIIDPKSQYLAVAAAACARDWDDAIIAGAFATALIGTGLATSGGFTSETFASLTDVQVLSDFEDGSTYRGLTVEKFREVRRLLRHHHVELERDPLTFVSGSQQESDLLGLVQVVSTEFNDRPVLVDGIVVRFLGFSMVFSERLATVTVSSNVVRNCIALTKSSMYLAMWKEMTSDVDQRKDITGLPYQIYVYHSFGATRLEPNRLVQVQCLDSTGADPMPT